MSNRVLGIVLLLGASILLLASAWAGKPLEGRGWRDARAFSGGPVHLPVAAARAVLLHHGEETSLRLSDDGRRATLPDLEMNAAVVRVEPREKTEAAYALNISVVRPFYGYLAGTGAILFLFGLASLFGKPDAKLGPLKEALSEPGGGMSLSRLQLLVWLVVTFFVLGTLTLPLLALPELEPSLAALFGLSGLTTVLGAAAHTPAPTDPATPETSSLRDTVEDWRGGLDVTRVQFLTLTLLGAIAVVGAFVSTLTIPSIPTGLLGLLGASQITYLGTKAIKSAQSTPPAQGAKGT